MHLIRDYAKSLTFVALTLIGYTALMFSYGKTAEARRDARNEIRIENQVSEHRKSESKPESKAETQIRASLHSHTEASIKTVVAPEIGQ